MNWKEQSVLHNKKINLDIVIIGRNEGNFLIKAINSVQNAAEELYQESNIKPRVVYVDGQSTDGSVKLAKHIAIETFIVNSKPTPAAGRHLGFQRTSGNYIMFIDGDMELYNDWLGKAISFLQLNKEYAFVQGILDWENLNEDKVIYKQKNYTSIVQDCQEIKDSVGGAGLYRRRALIEAGDWDPTLSRGEEFELYLRLVSNGWKGARIKVPMAVHRDQRTKGIREFIKRFVLNWNIFIPGVVARKSPPSKQVRKIIFCNFWPHVAHLLLMLSLFTVLLIRNSNNWETHWVAFVIFLVSLIFLLHLHFKNWNLKRALLSVFSMNFYSLAFFIGYLFKFPNVGGYFKDPAGS